MASQESHAKDETERVVRRELRSQDNARFLRALPAFKLDHALPHRLASLLDQLSQAETNQRASGNQSSAFGAASGAERT